MLRFSVFLYYQSETGESVIEISSNIDKRNITKIRTNCEVIKQFLVFVFHSNIMMRSEITN